MKRNYLSAVVFLMAALLFSVTGRSEAFPPFIDLGAGDSPSIMTVKGELPGGHLGLNISAGDVNGDYIDDLIMCASDGDRVYIVFGSPDLRDTTIFDINTAETGVVKLSGETGNNEFGTWSAVGDVDGDGIGDLVFTDKHASPLGRNRAGRAYILFGSYNLSSHHYIDVTNTDLDILDIYAAHEDDTLGFGVSSGDFNGDGIADIVIGAQGMGSEYTGMRSNAGGAYVIFGGSFLRDMECIDLSTPPDNVILEIFGEKQNDNTGWSVSVGDIDGDGIDDALLGAIFADTAGREDAGGCYVVFGSDDLRSKGSVYLHQPEVPALWISGAVAGGFLGNSVSAGDVNGDGFDDIVANGYAIDALGRRHAGGTYVVFGSADAQTLGQIDLADAGSRAVLIAGENRSDFLGSASAGDINGDGYDDVIDGAIHNHNLSDKSSGAGYVIFGRYDFSDFPVIDLADSPVETLKIFGKDDGHYTGMRCSAGDIDGDGCDDAFFSAHAAGLYGAGEVYVLWGSGGPSSPPPRFAFTPNTGNNALVMIPASAAPTVFDSDIEPGDAIGVFTPEGICAGSGTWTGDNLVLTVWGDNLYEDGINGFLDGEQYSLRILDRSENRASTAAVTFSEGEGIYRIDGISVVSSLSVEPADLVVPLATGWNLVSSSVAAADMAMGSILAGIEEHIELAKNGAGEIYWPAFSIDQIKTWSVADGYQIYMKESAELVVSGYEIFSADMMYRLSPGWSLISYIGPEGIGPAAAFAGITENLVIVKNGAGDVFWPEYGIDDIGAIHRGEGYWVNVKAQTSFAYPASSGKHASVLDFRPQPRHFKPAAREGDSAVILVKDDAAAGYAGVRLRAGDEIGVFTGTGLCAGAAVYNGGNCAVTVRGDDEFTDAVDGMAAGESYRFVLWDADTGCEREVKPVFSSGEAVYTANGILVLEALCISGTVSEGVHPLQYSLLRNTPNPFNPATTILFTLPEESRVTLTVYDITGKKIAELANGVFSAGEHNVMWDASGCASGVYFYRMKTGDFERSMKMTLVK